MRDQALLLVAGLAGSHLQSHQAAYVALYRNNGARARALASASLSTAQRDGFFDIAASSLTRSLAAAARSHHER